MYNILITGGAGFIGSNFVKLIKNFKQFSKIIIIDKLTSSSNLKNINSYIDKKRIFFLKLDILDFNRLTSVFEQNKINSIINFAAETHVDLSINNPDVFVKTNIIGTYNLLACCLKYWNRDFSNKIFFQISTDEVYGSLSENDNPVNENHKYNPQNPYSASKASADFLVKSFQNTYGLNSIISHSCNNYGYYQHPDKFIPLTITNILRGKNIPIYGDGNNYREWIFVDDCCRAVLSIFLKGKIGSNYNISTNKMLKNIELVNLICELSDNYLLENNKLKKSFPNSPIYNSNKSCDLITFVEDRPGHDFKYSINSDKILNEIGFIPKTDFKDGLLKTIDWYANNINWWSDVLKN